MNKTIPYGENVTPPACYSEAYACLKEMQTAIERIKMILAGAGLWTAPVGSDHPPPLTDGELFTAMANAMQDINAIKGILIDQGYVDNNELIPLSPRWRVDGQQQHYRNRAIFEENVFRCIEKFNAGEPPEKWIPAKNKVEPSR